MLPSSMVGSKWTIMYLWFLRYVFEESFSKEKVFFDKAVHSRHVPFFFAKFHSIGEILYHLGDQNQTSLTLRRNLFYLIEERR